MKVSFRKATLPGERGALARFDRAIFSEADAFDPQIWDELESYWMIVDGRRVGCCALARNTDFDAPSRPGSLYIVSTGILPRYQRRGYGDRFKRWQIAWARRHGFHRIVTNSRRGNRAMIRLNQKHGFKRIGVTRGDYYRRPAEAAVVMELKLERDVLRAPIEARARGTARLKP